MLLKIQEDTTDLAKLELLDLDDALLQLSHVGLLAASV